MHAKSSQVVVRLLGTILSLCPPIRLDALGSLRTDHRQESLPRLLNLRRVRLLLCPDHARDGRWSPAGQDAQQRPADQYAILAGNPKHLPDMIGVRRPLVSKEETQGRIVLERSGKHYSGLIQMIRQNTQRIVLTGSEADYGASLKVNITEKFLIQDIWDRIYQSRPYDVWYASGYRQLDFYTRDQLTRPSLTLMVNASDACHIKGSSERFRCPGMDTVLMKLLKQEHERRVKSE